MTAALDRQSHVDYLDALRAEPSSEYLIVDSSDIQFWNTSFKCLHIEITVRNTGPTRSPATPMTVQSAPLGAFVAWRPLTTTMIPELDPDESYTAEFEVDRANTRPLGNFSNVPPQRLLTALAADDDSQRPHPFNRMGRQLLADDIFELLGQANAHWAGNLNVFIGARPVERHMARALRIYPGHTCLAMFIVGEKRDAYQFRIAGADELWQVALGRVCARSANLLGHHREADLIRESEWIALHGDGVILALLPPESATQGEIHVHVTQRSTMEEAIVEFSFDASAAGPGCYVV